nr:protodermal factor 1-like [Arachis hypogaea]
MPEQSGGDKTVILVQPEGDANIGIQYTIIGLMAESPPSLHYHHHQSPPPPCILTATPTTPTSTTTSPTPPRTLTATPHIPRHPHPPPCTLTTATPTPTYTPIIITTKQSINDDIIIHAQFGSDANIGNQPPSQTVIPEQFGGNKTVIYLQSEGDANIGIQYTIIGLV